MDFLAHHGTCHIVVLLPHAALGWPWLLPLGLGTHPPVWPGMETKVGMVLDSSSVLQAVLKGAGRPLGSGSAVYGLSWVPGLEPVITQRCTPGVVGFRRGCFPWC